MATYALTDNGTAGPEMRPEVQGDMDPHVIMLASGDFGGGTLVVEYSVDQTNWVEDGTISLSDDGVARFAVATRLWYRAVLAGASGPDMSVTFLP